MIDVRDCLASVLFQEFYGVICFKSLRQFGKTVLSERVYFNFIDLHAAVQLSQHHLVKKLFTSYGIFCRSQVCGFASWLSVLSHLSICLFLCHYKAVLIAVALQYCLKSGRVRSPALFFFFKIVLDVLGLYVSIQVLGLFQL